MGRDKETGRQGDKEIGRQREKEISEQSPSPPLLVSSSPCLPLSPAPHSPAPHSPAPHSPLPLVLIGYRGTGKTTVARLLGQALGCEAFDADLEIERLVGKSIRRIFEEDGETRFRDWESEVVAELVPRAQAVHALGGGAVLREANRQVLARATVVWLTADADTLHARISADSATSQQRPDLTAGGGRDEIVRLLRQRESIYRACADYTVDTVSKTPHQVAEEIVCLVGQTREGQDH